MLASATPARMSAQDSTRTTKSDSSASKASAPAAALPFDFSGVIYTNFQTGGVKGNRAQNRFELDRAYLTFRSTAGERASIRVTLDVYQQRDTTLSDFYRGWTMRAKYAYAQYDYLRGGADALKANVRLGMLHTVMIEREEIGSSHGVWMRGLSQVAVEQAGYFRSSDLGVATSITLPKKQGEIYAIISNGPGYSARENDRFKDYAARLTLTPLANTKGYWKGFAVSPWVSIGRRASDFADRDHGTVRRIDSGLQKDRYGLLLQVHDNRVGLGAHFARRMDVVESADTTRDVAPRTVDRTGALSSVYAIVRPSAFIEGMPRPLSVVLRADNLKPDRSAELNHRFYIAGVTWDLNKKTSVTLDYQSQQPRNGSRVPDAKTLFVHVIANF